MSGFVLDVSVTMAWCFEDEGQPETWAILDRLEAAIAHVPTLWPVEVANVLIHAERRGRTSLARAEQFLGLLKSLPIEIDRDSSARAFNEILLLARTKQLTAYDACYLDLAMRRGLPLATMDKVLRKAAARNGLALLPA